MKHSFYSFIVATSLIGSVARAEPSIKDLPKPSEHKKTSWTEVALYATVIGGTVGVFGHITYGGKKTFDLFSYLNNLFK